MTKKKQKTEYTRDHHKTVRKIINEKLKEKLFQKVDLDCKNN